MTDTTEAVGAIIKTDARGRMRVSSERRQTLLAEYDQSGLSAKRFVQVAGLKYQTLASWLQKRRRPGGSPAPSADSVRWLEAVVEKAKASGPPGTGVLVVALPCGARLEIGDAQQAALAGLLLRSLAQTSTSAAESPC